MKRRVFLGTLGAAVGTGSVGLWWWWRGAQPGGHDQHGGPDEAAAAGPPTAPDGRPVFPALHRETLQHLVWRLVPDEPEVAGAKATGAFDYIERQLALPELQGARRTAMRGATVLDRVTRSRHQKLFSRVDPDAQDAVITAMFAGEGTSEKLDAADFLKLMLGLTLEGMLCQPQRGGNRDGLGWASIGYLMHPPRPGDCHPGVEECEE